MGLFEKTVKCANCGKEFTKGMLSGEKLCRDCRMAQMNEQMRQIAIKKQLDGVREYYNWLPKKYRKPPAEISQIIAHRDEILKKYMLADIVTDDDIFNACARHEEMTSEECEAFVQRLKTALMATINFDSLNNFFFIPHAYDGVVVELSSVFAVGIVKNFQVSGDAFLCAMFTNDPFFPAVGMTIVPAERKLFDFDFKGTHKIELLAELMNKLFPNLTYPAMDLKELQKTITNEKAVRGNIELQMMKDLISDAKLCSGVFFISPTYLESKGKMPFGITNEIKRYGFRSIEDVKERLFIDKEGRDFWVSYLINGGIDPKSLV